MTIINDNTVVVFSFEELKNILEGTNTYNYIYFGSNISLTSGIKIASTKASITIDGKYNNEIYTLEDRKSLNASDYCIKKPHQVVRLKFQFRKNAFKALFKFSNMV